MEILVQSPGIGPQEYDGIFYKIACGSYNLSRFFNGIWSRPFFRWWMNRTDLRGVLMVHGWDAVCRRRVSWGSAEF